MNYIELANILNSQMTYLEMRRELNYDGNINSDMGILLNYLYAIMPEKYPFIFDILYMDMDPPAKRIKYF